MSGLNRILILPALLLLLAACVPPKRIADFNEQQITNPAHTFFREIPEIANHKFTHVILYKTRFMDSYIETNGTLDFGLVNDSGKKGVSYLNVHGDTQEVYLIQVKAEDDLPTAFIYMSAKYDATPACIGFGPAYYGHYDDSLNVINFHKKFKVSKSKEGEYYLKKSKKSESLIFVPADTLWWPTAKTIRIEKIVLGEKNKIGGKRPLVFKVSELMKDIDLQYLYFTSFDTLTLN
jgi:hypothetical protein